MRTRTIARLASTTVVLGAAALVVATSTSASALSCVMPSPIAEGAKHLFSGRIIDSDANRILMEVESQRPGEPVPAEVWLTVDLAGWMVWEGDHDLDPGGGVPQHYSSQTRWLVATDGDWKVNPCTMWWASEPYVEGIAAQTTVPLVPEDGAPETNGAGAGEQAGEQQVAVSSEGTDPAAPETDTLAAAASGVGLGAVLAVGGLWWRRRPVGRRASR